MNASQPSFHTDTTCKIDIQAGSVLHLFSNNTTLLYNQVLICDQRAMNLSPYYMWLHVPGSQDTLFSMVAAGRSRGQLHTKCDQRYLLELGLQSPTSALRIWPWDPENLHFQKNQRQFLRTLTFYNSGLRNRADTRAMVKEASESGEWPNQKKKKLKQGVVYHHHVLGTS